MAKRGNSSKIAFRTVFSPQASTLRTSAFSNEEQVVDEHLTQSRSESLDNLSPLERKSLASTTSVVAPAPDNSSVTTKKHEERVSGTSINTLGMEELDETMDSPAKEKTTSLTVNRDHFAHSPASPQQGEVFSEERAGEGLQTSAGPKQEKGAVVKGWKTYDEDLALALEHQGRWAKEKSGGRLAGSGNSAAGTVSPTKGKQIANRPGALDDAVVRDNTFDFTMPLLGTLTGKKPRLSSPAPTLLTLLSHPVCVELVKAELQQIHSLENLGFNLHAQRYRQVSRPGTRKMVACCIYGQFIKPGAPQEININTRQRDAITQGIWRNGDDGCRSDLFQEAEREVLMLIETNVMKSRAAFVFVGVGHNAYRSTGGIRRGASRRALAIDAA